MLGRILAVLMAMVCIAVVIRVWQEVRAIWTQRSAWRGRFARQHKFLLGKMEQWGDQFPTHLPDHIPPILHIVAPPTPGGEAAARTAVAKWRENTKLQHLEVRMWTAADAASHVMAGTQDSRVRAALVSAMRVSNADVTAHMVRLMLAAVEGGWVAAPHVHPGHFPLRMAAYHRKKNHKIEACVFSTGLKAWIQAQGARAHPVRSGTAELDGERLTPDVLGCIKGHPAILAILGVVADRVLDTPRLARTLDTEAYNVSYMAGEDAVTTAVRTRIPGPHQKHVRLAPFPTSTLFFTNAAA